MSKKKVLAFGFETMKKVVDTLVDSSKAEISYYNSINEIKDFCKKLESGDLPTDPNVVLVIYFHHKGELLAHELIQLLTFHYPEVTSFYLTDQRAVDFDRGMLLKNGFKDVFYLPFEQDLFLRKSQAFLNEIMKEKSVNLAPVSIMDIHPGSVLDFDVYIMLPFNKKYIKIVNAGFAIDEKAHKKIMEHQMSVLFIPRNDLGKFKKQVATNLSNISKNGKLTPTEKQEKFVESFRGLVGRIFDTEGGEGSKIEQGTQLFMNLKDIVSDFITMSDPASWYKNLTSTIKLYSDPYAHATRVSTYAAIFSSVLGGTNPEDMATAGLFHDLGMADLPGNLQTKAFEEMTKDERNLYILHPELSIRALKEKKVVLPPNVEKAILNHHETFGGSGFPKRISGERIGVEGQILAIADEFDELTTIQEGRKSLSPLQAIEKMSEGVLYNPMMLKNLRRLFQENEKGQVKAS